MRFIKIEGIWVHKDIHSPTSKPEEELNERWIPSDISANNDSFNPMPTKEILVRVIKSAINIIKEEPLREIINSTLTESAQIKALRNILLPAIPTTTPITSDSYAVFKNEEYM